MSSIRSTNPATNLVEKEFPVMSGQQIETILADADKAFKMWKKTSFAERAELLKNVASILRKRKFELGRLCTVEMGKLHKEGIWEVEFSAGMFEYYAENGEKFLADIPIKTPHGSAFLTHEPIGVLLSIQPWNFPFYQVARSAAPNIMAGNTFILKHASNVPQAAEAIEKIFAEAGAPKGVYTNLFVPGAEVSGIIADPRIRGVSFTGSQNAGSSVASEAGKHVKKSLLELGGSDAFIVMPDADLDTAVEAAAMGRLFNAGQVCTSPKRIIVPESMAAGFIEKSKSIYENIIVGDPLDADTQLAPINSEKALAAVLKQVEITVEQGAILVTGGKRINRPGAFMEPTILTGIKKGMLAYSEEIFGPVLAIYPVKDINEAVELTNDTKFGLGASIFGTDVNKAVEMARRLDVGMVFINHITMLANELPFGGTKDSGYGREHGAEAMHEFINAKLVRITTPDAEY